MGKLHSKPAAVCKRRESPEGDSFAVSAAWARKGIEEWIGRQRCPGGSSGPRQLRAVGTVGRGTRELVGEVFRETLSEEEEEDFRLEVALPPEKTDGLASGDEKRMEKVGDSCPGSKKQLKFDELQCDVSVEEDSRQEWTFTLYDFDNNGKVTREDITSLLHTIYEVVDSSVNHSPTSSKTLRVKLTVAPDGSQSKKSILLNHPAEGLEHHPARGDLQSTRPRAETKPAEELRSWEKKQRALLRLPVSGPEVRTAPPRLQPHSISLPRARSCPHHAPEAPRRGPQLLPLSRCPLRQGLRGPAAAPGWHPGREQALCEVPQGPGQERECGPRGQRGQKQTPSGTRRPCSARLRPPGRQSRPPPHAGAPRAQEAQAPRQGEPAGVPGRAGAPGRGRPRCGAGPRAGAARRGGVREPGGPGGPETRASPPPRTPPPLPPLLPDIEPCPPRPRHVKDPLPLPARHYYSINYCYYDDYCY
uniref:Protein naked cuticle homolog n=1 Tax=Sus scrofa TaxID=9823 RepID=A0A8D1SX91_PIG